MTSRKRKHSLEAVVGSQTYTVWVDMLQRLVPDGRTHRLAPLVAAMLSYAAEVAAEQDQDDDDEDSVAQILQDAAEITDPAESPELMGLVAQLFKDAQVKHQRESSRGVQYSIAEEAIIEFIHWYDMPWES
jgi:hypothetical protein